MIAYLILFSPVIHFAGQLAGLLPWSPRVGLRQWTGKLGDSRLRGIFALGKHQHLRAGKAPASSRWKSTSIFDKQPPRPIQLPGQKRPILYMHGLFYVNRSQKLSPSGPRQRPCRPADDSAIDKALTIIYADRISIQEAP
jgi:hypothetical protein